MSLNDTELCFLLEVTAPPTDLFRLSWEERRGDEKKALVFGHDHTLAGASTEGCVSTWGCVLWSP